MMMLPLVLSVHAPDAGGGDGFVADAAVLGELECKTAFVATSVVVPEPLPLAWVAKQLEAAERAGPIAAIRIGFLRGTDHTELLARTVSRVGAPAVVACPARAGADSLLDEATRSAIVRHLYPVARVIVVRAADVAASGGGDIEDLSSLREAAARLRDQGARAVLISGWLRQGRVIDLIDDGGALRALDTARIQAPRVSGLAGAYAAALAAHLARGLALSEAADAAQRYIGLRLRSGR
jgi:hydroxymethylpyrimidine/phosphomethylpyrimidine kinase